MLTLIAVGDPVLDTHIQIGSDSPDCRLIEEGNTMLAFTYGAKIPIIDSFQSLGGNAANVAVGIVKLGLTAAVVSTVGDDSNGHVILDHLKRAKVDTSLITMESATATRYSVVLNYKTERTILSYSEKKKYIWPEPVPETEWIYYTGLSDGYENLQAKLMEYLTNHPSIRLVVNPGSYMLRYGAQELDDILAKTDILIVNLEEAEKLLGKKLENQKSVESLVHALLKKGAKEVVITDGIRGAWGGNNEAVHFVEAFPVEVVAKTGAGDAFSAAYVAARAAGHDIWHALLWGTANSCSVISAEGPHAGLLTKAGIEKYIVEHTH